MFRPVQPGFYRSGLQVEHICQLFVAQSPELPQNDDVPGFVRQFAYGLCHRFLPFFLQDLLFRAGFVIRQIVMIVDIFPAGVMFSFSQLVETAVDQDAREPGLETAVALEGPEIAVHFDKSFLHDVSRIGVVLHIAERDGISGILDTTNEGRECILVPLLRQFYCPFQLKIHARG